MIMMVIQLMLSAAGASASRQERELPAGVTKRDGKYRVQIWADRKQHCLGTYESVSEAGERYKAALAARETGTFHEFLKHNKVESPKTKQRGLPKGVYIRRGKYQVLLRVDGKR